MRPAVAFCKALSERASRDGWKLMLASNGFIWKHDIRNITYAVPLITDDTRELFFEACAHLDRAQYNLSVPLT